MNATNNMRVGASRRAAAVAAAMLMLLVSMAAPAHAMAGAGASEAGEGARKVVGSGTWTAAGGSTLTVVYACSVTGSGDTISATVRTPAQGGCVLKRNGVVIDTAPGRTLPGSTSASTETASFSLKGTTKVEVCWNVYVSYFDGDLRSTSDCTEVSLLDIARPDDIYIANLNQITAGGSVIVGAVVKNNLTIAYECHAISPAAAATSLEVCELRDSSGTVVHTAQRRSLPGPGVVTAGVATVSLHGAPYRVCWQASAQMITGERPSTAGCATPFAIH